MSFKSNIQIVENAYNSLNSVLKYLSPTHEPKPLSEEDFRSDKKTDFSQVKEKHIPIRELDNTVLSLNIFANAKSTVQKIEKVDSVREKENEDITDEFLFNKGTLVLQALKGLAEIEEVFKAGFDFDINLVIDDFEQFITQLNAQIPKNMERRKRELDSVPLAS